jgi:hypothetical protein
MHVARIAVVILAVLAGTGTIQTQAQAAVTTSDLTRLDTMVTGIERQIAALKKTDPTLAGEVERTLADLRDEVTYLKVKLRRERGVTREEVTTLQDRLETLALKARGDKVSAQPVLDDPVSRMWTLSVDTQLDVRLQTPLNSGTTKVEHRFEATTIVDYEIDKQIVIPAGSLLRGFVSSVRPAGRVDRVGSITLSFDELRIDKRSYRLRASVLQAMDGKVSEDATRIGAGAIVGGIVGGIIGGTKGALLGVIIGGGGAIAARDGADVDLPLGTILRVRFDQPVDIVKIP